MHCLTPYRSSVNSSQKLDEGSRFSNLELENPGVKRISSFMGLWPFVSLFQRDVSSSSGNNPSQKPGPLSGSPGGSWANLAVYTSGPIAGGFIGVVGQPVYVLKTLKQQAPKQSTYFGICTETYKQRGLSGFFRGLSLSIPKSAIKQGVKGGVYAVADQRELTAAQKAVIASGAITLFVLPVDGLVNGMIGNSKMTTRQTFNSITSGGVSRIYRGWKVDGFKNLTEAGCVYGLRSFQKSYLQAMGKKNSNQLNWLEWFTMTGVATGIKLTLTNFCDVTKTELQKHLKSEGAPITVRDVYQLKGFRHFFFAGMTMRFIMNYLGMAGSFGTLEIQDYFKRLAEAGKV